MKQAASPVELEPVDVFCAHCMVWVREVSLGALDSEPDALCADCLQMGYTLECAPDGVVELQPPPGDFTAGA